MDKKSKKNIPRHPSLLDDDISLGIETYKSEVITRKDNESRTLEHRSPEENDKQRKRATTNSKSDQPLSISPSSPPEIKNEQTDEKKKSTNSSKNHSDHPRSGKGHKDISEAKTESISTTKLTLSTNGNSNDKKDENSIEEIELKKKRDRRQNVIKEILETEATYLDFLQITITSFQTPLSKRKDSAEFSQTVFQNIQAIQNLHWNSYRVMGRRVSKYSHSNTFCDILVELFSKKDFVEEYQTYINGYDLAAANAGNAKKAYTSRSLLSSDPLEGIGELIEKQLATNKFGFSSLSSFLISPVQRLPRYLLFLKDLHSCTPSDHADKPYIQQALEILQQSVALINKHKGVYDQLYRLEEIFNKFDEVDQPQVTLISDPVRELLAEGPMYEGMKKPKLRYILLFTDLVVCATKHDENRLSFEWKINLSNSVIEYKNSESEKKKNCISIISQRKITTYPFTLKETHLLRAVEDDPKYTQSFWEDKFKISENSKKNLIFLSNNTNFLAMRKSLYREIAEEKFFTEWEHVTYSKGDIVCAKGDRVEHLLFIINGKCNIQIKLGEEIKVVSETEVGSFVGEFSYLAKERETNNIASADVVAATNSVQIIRRKFSELDDSMTQNALLASKFFQLMSISLAQRFIKQKVEGRKDEKVEMSAQIKHQMNKAKESEDSDSDSDSEPETEDSAWNQIYCQYRSAAASSTNSPSPLLSPATKSEKSSGRSVTPNCNDNERSPRSLTPKRKLTLASLSDMIERKSSNPEPVPTSFKRKSSRRGDDAFRALSPNNNSNSSTSNTTTPSRRATASPRVEKSSNSPEIEKQHDMKGSDRGSGGKESPVVKKQKQISSFEEKDNDDNNNGNGQKTTSNESEVNRELVIESSDKRNSGDNKKEKPKKSKESKDKREISTSGSEDNNDKKRQNDSSPSSSPSLSASKKIRKSSNKSNSSGSAAESSTNNKKKLKKSKENRKEKNLSKYNNNNSNDGNDDNEKTTTTDAELRKSGSLTHHRQKRHSLPSKTSSTLNLKTSFFDFDIFFKKKKTDKKNSDPSPPSLSTSSDDNNDEGSDHDNRSHVMINDDGGDDKECLASSKNSNINDSGDGNNSDKMNEGDENDQTSKRNRSSTIDTKSEKKKKQKKSATNSDLNDHSLQKNINDHDDDNNKQSSDNQLTSSNNNDNTTSNEVSSPYHSDKLSKSKSSKQSQSSSSSSSSSSSNEKKHSKMSRNTESEPFINVAPETEESKIGKTKSSGDTPVKLYTEEKHSQRIESESRYRSIGRLRKGLSKMDFGNNNNSSNNNSTPSSQSDTTIDDDNRSGSKVPSMSRKKSEFIALHDTFNKNVVQVVKSYRRESTSTQVIRVSKSNSDKSDDESLNANLRSTSASSQNANLNSSNNNSNPALNDAVYYQSQCSLIRKDRKERGELTLTKYYVIFNSKFFGFTNKKLIPYTSVTKFEEAEENTNILRIYYVSDPSSSSSPKFKDFSLKNSNELQTAIHTIASSRQAVDPRLHLTSSGNNDGDHDVQKKDFFKLRSKDWELILSTAHKMKINEGTIIVEQGTILNAMYQVVSGCCRVEVIQPDGSSLKVGMIPEGEVFGEISFLLGVVSSASVVADGACTVMALNKSELEILLFNEPRVGTALYRFICQMLRDRLLFNIAKKNAENTNNSNTEDMQTTSTENKQEDNDNIKLEDM